MGWKEWPYWLKGGIMGLIVYLIIFGLFFIVSLNCRKGFCGYISINTVLYFFVSIIFLILNIDIIPYLSNPLAILFILVNLTAVFVIGSLIGFIIGKIKSRGEE